MIAVAAAAAFARGVEIAFLTAASEYASGVFQRAGFKGTRRPWRTARKRDSRIRGLGRGDTETRMDRFGSSRAHSGIHRCSAATPDS